MYGQKIRLLNMIRKLIRLKLKASNVIIGGHGKLYENWVMGSNLLKDH